MASFDVVVDAEADFLRVTTAGKYEFTELFGFLERVKSEATKAEKRNILIDSRELEGNMTEAERFQGGQKIAEIFGSRLKLALLMPAQSITKLGELTAINRGARFLVTDREDEALEWLLDPSQN